MGKSSEPRVGQSGTFYSYPSSKAAEGVREERKSKCVSCENTSNSGMQLVWSSGTHSKNALLECCGVCCAAFGLFKLEVEPTDCRRLN